MNKIQTNWCAITGAPSSGKTSVINELERRGYRVTHETARAIIDSEMAAGKTLQEARGDVASFQQRVLDIGTAQEEQLNPDDTVFLDRALPDSLAYHRLHGLDEAPVLAALGKHIYRSVFFFEPLKVRQDGVRTEDDATANQIGALLEKAYAETGYEIIRVPLMSVEERTDFILEKLHDTGRILAGTR